MAVHLIRSTALELNQLISDNQKLLNDFIKPVSLSAPQYLSIPYLLHYIVLLQLDLLLKLLGSQDVGTVYRQEAENS